MATREDQEDVKRLLEAEPHITVNGAELTPAQAMSVRVAIGHFRDFCRETPWVVGDVKRSYEARLAEVERMMGVGE